MIYIYIQAHIYIHIYIFIWFSFNCHFRIYIHIYMSTMIYDLIRWCMIWFDMMMYDMIWYDTIWYDVISIVYVYNRLSYMFVSKQLHIFTISPTNIIVAIIVIVIIVIIVIVNVVVVIVVRSLLLFIFHLSNKARPQSRAWHFKDNLMRAWDEMPVAATHFAVELMGRPACMSSDDADGGKWR